MAPVERNRSFLAEKELAMASSGSRSGADSLCTHSSAPHWIFPPSGLRIQDGHPADLSIGDASLDSQHIAGHGWL